MRHTKYTEKIILEELKKIIEEIGHFPTFNDMWRMGYSGLNKAIYQLGFNKAYFQELLGFKSKISWSVKLAKKILTEQTSKLGKYPTFKDVLTINKPLAGAISHSKLGFTNLIKELT